MNAAVSELKSILRIPYSKRDYKAGRTSWLCDDASVPEIWSLPGSTLSEILRMLGRLNPSLEVYVFTLVGGPQAG